MKNFTKFLLHMRVLTRYKKEGLKKIKNRKNSRKIIYYEDESHEEFSRARITPRIIDGNFRYFHGCLWEFCSFVMQNILSMPVKILYTGLKFRIKYVGREKFKLCKNSGYFIYGNHTQPIGDTMIPSLANYPKRNFFIVSAENVSIPGLRGLVPLLGAIPVPCDFEGMKHFLKSVEDKIRKKNSVTIYPEARIWPYDTHIRPYEAVSFRYPVKFTCPVYVLTNTYHRRGKHGRKARIITYIDGPFYPDESLKSKDKQRELRDRVYKCMEARSRKSDFEYIEYRKKRQDV